MKLGFHFLVSMLAAFLLCCSPAIAQKTKTQLQTEVTTNLPDNTSGAITPAIMRTTLNDFILSWTDWLTCTGTGGMVYWSSGTPTCLNIGSTNQIHVVSGGIPAWANISTLFSAGQGIAISGTTSLTIAFATQANNTITSNISGSAAAPIGNSLVANGGILDSYFGATTGLTIYRAAGSSGWVVLSPCATNQSVIFNASSIPTCETILANVQTFTSSGTWTKPTGYGATATVHIQCWGGGGSGGSHGAFGGGGGGAYNDIWVPLANLAGTVTVTVGSGGTAASGTSAGNAGGNTSFGSVLLAFGGGGGGINGSLSQGGGGGGQLSAGAAGASGGASGAPVLSGLGCGDNGSNVCGPSLYNGGGGGGVTSGGTPSQGIPSVFGGGGGGGGTTVATSVGGTSQYGGNGSASSAGTASPGSQPGGGSGTSGSTTGAAGGAGECIVSIFGAP